MSISVHALGFAFRKPRALKRLPAFRLDRARLAVALLGLLVLLSASYVVLVNQATSARLKLDALSSTVRDLKETNHRLQLTVAQAQSVQGADRAAQLLGLQPVARTEYLSGPSGDVAVSR
jgi:hypothetical protein